MNTPTFNKQTALLYDNKADHTKQAGFHALIVGIGNYQSAQNLQPLTSAAFSAHAIAQKLIDLANENQLQVPLATCRLLIDAFPSSMDTILSQYSQPINKSVFQDTVISWIADARAHADNMSFLYFAGHGIQLSGNDRSLLLGDFKNTWNDAINIQNIVRGMSREPRYQLYFFDTCHIFPDQLRNNQSPVGTNIIDDIPLQEYTPDFRLIVNASASGHPAFAQPEGHTFLCDVLLNCLNGEGADIDTNDEDHWVISFLSLDHGLKQLKNTLARTKPWQIHEDDITLETQLSSTPNNSTIRVFQTPPITHHIFKIHESHPTTNIRVDIQDSNRKRHSTPTIIYPSFSLPLTPGVYRYSVHNCTVVSEKKCRIKQRKPLLIMPPAKCHQLRCEECLKCKRP
jgi:Caspase domain